MVSRKSCVCVSFWNNAHTIRFPLQEMCQNGSTDNEREAGGGYEDRQVQSCCFVMFYSGSLLKLKKNHFNEEKD